MTKSKSDIWHNRTLKIGVALMSVVLSGAYSPARSQESKACVEEYFEKPKDVLGIAQSEAEELIQQVANSLALGLNNVVVISCGFAKKAQAYYPGPNAGVPEGEYIIYDPTWVREVIGKDRVQAVALFGHELGHFLNRHFTARRMLTRQEMETEADHFAGCAVARMNGDLGALENLLSRLRGEQDTNYPNRLKSMEAAKSGFERCGGLPKPPTPTPPPVTVTYKVCSGEYQRACQPHDVYMYCYADVNAWAKQKCGSYTVQRLQTYGGNKCGYTIDSVVCTAPRS